MKNIIKNLLIAFIVITITSCENDKEPIASAEGISLRKDETVISTSVITDASSTTTFTKLNWDSANNGVASVSTYSLVIFDHDNDPNLLNPVEYSGQGLTITPNSREGELTEKEFNDLVNQLPTFRCTQMNIDIRIKSTLGLDDGYATPFIQYSNPITYSIIAKPTSLPIIAFVKEENSNDVKNQPKLAASATDIETDFEGYMYLTAGSYKFYQPDACGDFINATVYGVATGLLDSNSTTAITVPTDGHYYVTVDLTTKAYQVKQFRSLGIFGNGVRIGPGVANATQLFYDASTKTWSRELELVKGRTFSFKTNLWTGEEVINTANNNPPTIPSVGTTTISYLELNNENKLISANNFSSIFGTIDVPGLFDNSVRQKYLITVDLNNPRDYNYLLEIK